MLNSINSFDDCMPTEKVATISMVTAPITIITTTVMLSIAVKSCGLTWRLTMSLCSWYFGRSDLWFVISEALCGTGFAIVLRLRKK